jgi:hypothetical protein
MDKTDDAVMNVLLIITLATVPTWIQDWFIYDLSNAIVIATLVLSLSFFVKEWYLIKFIYFLYIIKLLNILSVVSNYSEWEYNFILDESKPMLLTISYIWLGFEYTKYVKGWEYK